MARYNGDKDLKRGLLLLLLFLAYWLYYYITTKDDEARDAKLQYEKDRNLAELPIRNGHYLTPAERLELNHYEFIDNMGIFHKDATCKYTFNLSGFAANKKMLEKADTDEWALLGLGTNEDLFEYCLFTQFEEWVERDISLHGACEISRGALMTFYQCSFYEYFGVVKYWALGDILNPTYMNLRDYVHHELNESEIKSINNKLENYGCSFRY